MYGLKVKPSSAIGCNVMANIVFYGQDGEKKKKQWHFFFSTRPSTSAFCNIKSVVCVFLHEKEIVSLSQTREKHPLTKFILSQVKSNWEVSSKKNNNGGNNHLFSGGTRRYWPNQRPFGDSVLQAWTPGTTSWLRFGNWCQALDWQADKADDCSGGMNNFKFRKFSKDGACNRLQNKEYSLHYSPKKAIQCRELKGNHIF